MFTISNSSAPFAVAVYTKYHNQFQLSFKVLTYHGRFHTPRTCSFQHPNESNDDVFQVLWGTKVDPLKHMEVETQLFSIAKRTVLQVNFYLQGTD